MLFGRYSESFILEIRPSHSQQFTMKSSSRIICCATLLLLIPLYLLKVHLEDFCDQYRAGAYLVDWVKSRYFPLTVPTLPHGRTGDKVIVMAKLEAEHTEWVEEELPEYVERFLD